LTNLAGGVNNTTKTAEKTDGSVPLARVNHIKKIFMKNMLSKKHMASAVATVQWVVLMLIAIVVLSGCAGDPSMQVNDSHQVGTQPATSIQMPSEFAKILSQTNVVNQPSSGTPTASVKLKEGDVINIAFPSSPSLDTTQKIRVDGKIALPLVGETQAAGMTPSELQDQLIKLFAPQVSTKQVIVTVQSSTFTVFVTGSVLRPGRVDSDHPLAVLEAIMEAGGFDTLKANLKDVVIIHQTPSGTTKRTINLKKIMEGSSDKPVYLQPSDIVFVPEKFVWF
jgi:polysaccharide export outer membrane protein